MSKGSEGAREAPSVILERDWRHFHSGIWFYQYQNLDGTLLKYKDVRAVVSRVPENRSVLAKERFCFIANIVTGVLAFVPLAMFCVLVESWPDAERAMSLLTALLANFLFMFFLRWFPVTRGSSICGRR
jgi:hypothetical protein